MNTRPVGVCRTAAMPQLSPAEIGSTARRDPVADATARRTVPGSSLHRVRGRVLRMSGLAVSVEQVMRSPSR
jgi:hypothetical protein